MTDRKTRDAIWARLLYAVGFGAILCFLGVPTGKQISDSLWTVGAGEMTWHLSSLVQITKSLGMLLGMLVVALLWNRLYAFWAHYYRMTWQDHLDDFKLYWSRPRLDRPK